MAKQRQPDGMVEPPGDMDFRDAPALLLPETQPLRQGVLWARVCRGLKPHQKLLAAVSGGGDSLALLLLLLPPEQERGRLLVGYVHHGTGAFAYRSQEHVRQLCERLKLQFITKRIYISPDRRRHIGFEAAARELRYQALEQMAHEHSAVRILSGHTRDDMAETFLLNSMRGAGLGGLSGLKVGRGMWFRPLLQRSRSELREFLMREGVVCLDDPSNEDIRYTRSRVRHELEPVIRAQFGDGAYENIARSLFHLQDADRALEHEAKRALGNVLRGRTPGWASIDAVKCGGYLDELIVRVFRYLIADVKQCPVDEVYFDRRDRARLLDLLRRSRPGRVVRVAGIAVTDRKNDLEFSVYGDGPRMSLDLPGKLELPDGSRVRVDAVEVNPGRASSVQGSEHPGFLERLDAGCVGKRVTFRPWYPGDSFHPLGSRSETVRVVRRLRRPARERIGPLWVMEVAAGGIAWVPGERIGDPYKVTEKTRRIFIFRYDPPAALPEG